MEESIESRACLLTKPEGVESSSQGEPGIKAGKIEYLDTWILGLCTLGEPHAWPCKVAHGLLLATNI